MNKVEELHGVNDEDKFGYQDNDGEFIDDSMLEEEHKGKYENQEIASLAQSMGDLAQIFKELNNLVVEQGTIVDRIDYNIEQALESTVQGKKHVVGAKKASDSYRAKWIILVLLVLIVIVGAIYVIKHL